MRQTWHRIASIAGPCLAAVLSMALATTLPAQTRFLGRGQSLSETVQRGKYLARAGDCIACHTKHDGPAFAGGLPMVTPFGTIYSPNITPDPDYGIGNWTADDFYGMLHTGRLRDGTLLYPAMPFPAYTKVTGDSLGCMGAFDPWAPNRQAPRRVRSCSHAGPTRRERVARHSPDRPTAPSWYSLALRHTESRPCGP